MRPYPIFQIVTVNGAVRLTTLEASNGIIYIIDKVLEVPEPQSTIVDILARNEAFTTLVTAVKAAGLASTLQSGQYNETMHILLTV